MFGTKLLQIGPETTVMTDIVKFFFGGFCNLHLVMSAQVYVSAENQQKVTLYGICYC